VLAEVEHFREIVLEAVAHYGVDADDDFQAWLDDTTLATLRRDALLSLNKLKVHQFSQGEGSEGNLKFNAHVYEFWNMNSLLRALRDQGMSGITLCLIRDPLVMASFFCFAIKNGSNITILTDSPDSPHPDFKKMTRRPDRDLARRAALNWFPYSLLDLEVSEDGKHLYEKARTGLVPINSSAIALTAFSDLHPATVVWATLVFELINAKYGGVTPYLLPDLSYTGEMVRVPTALVGEHGALVVDGHYKPLDLAPLSREDMQDVQALAGFGRSSTGFNQWMIDRYQDQVPEAVFNTVGQHEADALLGTIETGDLTPRPNPDMWRDKNPLVHLQLDSLDPVAFGTKESLEKDRAWVARKNQVEVIQRLAEEEFLRERENVLEWYREHVRANRYALIAAVTRGEFVTESYTNFGFTSPWEAKRKNILSIKERKNHQWYDKEDPFPSWVYPDVILSNRDVYTGGAWYCFDKPDVRATIFGAFFPDCPEALADLCGCGVGDLPWALQHWFKDEPYVGNPILQRVDHAEWSLNNPWRPKSHKGLNLSVAIAFSKRALNARKKG
jgi:hypothetical protein